MLEKDLPVYTFSVKGFAGNAQSEYYTQLEAHVRKKNSKIK